MRVSPQICDGSPIVLDNVQATRVIGSTRKSALAQGEMMENMMLGLLGALNSGVTLGLANTILTFGGVVLNLNIVVN
ncbi:hypothetical protein CBI38_05695 [Rhodococcus oxybenzonivorans]|uniref:Uncharacterized protein n=3 Tax=Rhodococcus TaxID=1827 RepID=A0A2S2BRF2_9NOCA|nr:hypothetical protein [Rhodococcus oxybenzonivorans]AWK71144.1 hypothetical protein CBI38_05695 [Rhodococcus oxybenzonivorans]